MPTFLAVVQRDRPDVFDRLRRVIDQDEVCLLWDRRRAERRAAWQPVGRDRRRGDRRRSPASTWSMLGFVIAPAEPEDVTGGAPGRVAPGSAPSREDRDAVD
jgi:hypothetical protein